MSDTTAPRRLSLATVDTPSAAVPELTPIVTDDRKWHRDCVDRIGDHPQIDHLTEGQRQNVAAVTRYIFDHQDILQDGIFWCGATYKDFASALGNVYRSKVREGLRGAGDNGIVQRISHPHFSHGYRYLYRIRFDELRAGFLALGAAPRLFAIEPDHPPRSDRADRLHQVEIQFSGVLQSQNELREEVACIRSAIGARDQSIDERISLLENRLRKLESGEPVDSVGPYDRFDTINHSPKSAHLNTIPTINHTINHMVYDSVQNRPVGPPDRVDRFPLSLETLQNPPRVDDRLRKLEPGEPVDSVGPPDRVDRFPLTLEMLQNPQRVDEWFEWALATRNAGNATAVDRQYVLAEAARVVRINREPKKGQKPPGIGAFISNVQKRNWFAAFEDEKKAALAIREMDGP